MNAIKFFKSMGLKSVKQFLENDNIRTKEMIDDLKQIVEAFELVESYGGLKESNNWINNIIISGGMTNIQAANCDLQKAINLVEQCQ